MGGRIARRLWQGHTVGRTFATLASAVVLAMTLALGLVAGGVFSSNGPVRAKQAGGRPDDHDYQWRGARRQLVSDVTMVPLTG